MIGRQLGSWERTVGALMGSFVVAPAAVLAQPTINEIAGEDGRTFVAVTGVSDNGVVCGYVRGGGEHRAALWTIDGALEVLDVPGNLPAERATAISANGVFVVGEAGPNVIGASEAFRWSRSSGARLLPQLSTGAGATTVRAVALDGTAVGSSRYAAVRWLPDDTIDVIPALQGATWSFASGIGAQGQPVVG